MAAINMGNLEKSGNLTIVNEKSGNLTIVNEKSGNLTIVREKSGKMCFACGVLPRLQWSQCFINQSVSHSALAAELLQS